MIAAFAASVAAIVISIGAAAVILRLIRMAEIEREWQEFIEWAKCMAGRENAAGQQLAALLVSWQKSRVDSVVEFGRSLGRSLERRP
jgi:hypothetical protein